MECSAQARNDDTSIQLALVTLHQLSLMSKRCIVAAAAAAVPSLTELLLSLLPVSLQQFTCLGL
jgi:hypothetical protein